ncbi:ATP-binding protein [Streptomyces olivochromogenes]|uniref:ATP-binding protein n=1 Tax=Streptomyces olivochromogenes TaxID=1963 RepID=UPI001F249393|nr:ATP-binding protein [Streptomyces olivochromogenes]MCF3131277.1 ATP-binding protein [Streptomyces olivochromogenes]
MTMTNERVRPGQYPRQSVTLASEAATVPVARQIVREACAEWGMDQDTADTGTLLISEIVTNAVRHGHSHSVRVIAEQPRPDRLRVAVVDKSRRLPELHIVGPDAFGGRGLLLVDALSHRWGTDLLPWGKRVWAEIAIKDGDQ